VRNAVKEGGDKRGEKKEAAGSQDRTGDLKNFSLALCVDGALLPAAAST